VYSLCLSYGGALHIAVLRFVHSARYSHHNPLHVCLCLLWRYVGVFSRVLARVLSSKIIEGLQHLVSTPRRPPLWPGVAPQRWRRTRAQQCNAQRGAEADDRRGGLATFRRGDCVISTVGGGAEEVVFGVTSFFHRKQQHRYLITFDAQLEDFSVGSWTAWRRTPADGTDMSTFDAEDSSKVKLCHTPSQSTCTSPPLLVFALRSSRLIMSWWST
jgi:hypothetical protein